MKPPFLVSAMLTGTLVLAVLPAFGAGAPVRVQYGRITNIQATTITDAGAQAAGTVIGGVAGLASGSGQSRSNRALRAVGGAAAGRGVGSLAGRYQAFEYTVLLDGRTSTRVISDQAGKRIGDCVAVEQGEFANIRLVPDDRCVARPGSEVAPPAASAVQAASACEQAKNQLLAASTDDEFSLAERRMRLLCGE